jgi:hypothetical protein
LEADTRDRWPDVPQDQPCSIDADTCASRTAPTFFTRKRLTGVETKILKADGTYRAVDSWALTHSFPDAGDGDDALWLDDVTHTGKPRPRRDDGGPCRSTAPAWSRRSCPALW